MGKSSGLWVHYFLVTLPVSDCIYEGPGWEMEKDDSMQIFDTELCSKRNSMSCLLHLKIVFLHQYLSGVVTVCYMSVKRKY